MDDRFAGKKVIVTGAAGVYGRELVYAFEAEGALVCAVDRDRASLDQFIAKLELAPDRVILVDSLSKRVMPSLLDRLMARRSPKPKRSVQA